MYFKTEHSGLRPYIPWTFICIHVHVNDNDINLANIIVFPV
jgi:hypothetical protein